MYHRWIAFLIHGSMRIDRYSDNTWKIFRFFEHYHTRAASVISLTTPSKQQLRSWRFSARVELGILISLSRRECGDPSHCRTGSQPLGTMDITA